MEEYFLNQPQSCIKLPEKGEKYFLKENLLGEIYTENEKALARFNLGVTPLLEELKALYNSTPIPSGNVRFGIEPTQRAYDEVLSSDTIYKTLQKYLTREQFESWLLTLDELLNRKVDKGETYTKDEFDSKLEEFRGQLDERIETLSIVEQNLNSVIERMETLIRTDAKITIQFINHTNTGTDIGVNISSQSVLKSVKVYINQLLVVNSDELCYSTQIPIHITENSTIKVITTNIFDIETVLEKDIVNDYFIPEDCIYIGGASNFQELFATETPKEFTNRYSILLNRDSNIILMIPVSQTFVRADMNGIEIPFNEPEIVNNFKVYTSKNTYGTGVYTIDINS